MNENPYKPPVSNLETAIIPQGEYFFTASTLKLVLMSICTFNLYPFYWFYKNWVLIKARTGENIMPFWRTFFTPIWIYSCFKHIKTSAVENDIPETLPIGLLAFIYIMLNVLGAFSTLFGIIALLSFTVLLPVNGIALSVNKKLVANFINNNKFSGWNWLVLVLGGLIFMFIPIEILLILTGS